MDFSVGLPEGALVLFGTGSWVEHRTGRDTIERSGYAQAQLMILGDELPEGLVVKLARLPEGLAAGQPVEAVGLRGRSWTFNGRSGVTFWADDIVAAGVDGEA